jgi:hypothetical protein
MSKVEDFMLKEAENLGINCIWFKALKQKAEPLTNDEIWRLRQLIETEKQLLTVWKKNRKYSGKKND